MLLFTPEAQQNFLAAKQQRRDRYNKIQINCRARAMTAPQNRILRRRMIMGMASAATMTPRARCVFGTVLMSSVTEYICDAAVNTVMIWTLYWLVLLALSIIAVYLCIDHWSHDELDQHNRELKHRIDQAELAYLRTKKTQSRIKFKPDL